MTASEEQYYHQYENLVEFLQREDSVLRISLSQRKYKTSEEFLKLAKQQLDTREYKKAFHSYNYGNYVHSIFFNILSQTF